MKSKMNSNRIVGEGTGQGEAWKRLLEGFRVKFPNLESFADQELIEILNATGVKCTQTFGEKQRVEADLEEPKTFHALSRFPRKENFNPPPKDDRTNRSNISQRDKKNG